MERYSDGTYKSFVPETDTAWVISGCTIVFAAGHRVKFFASGRLERCVLAAKATLHVFGAPVVLAADTALVFHESGEVRSFTVGPQWSWIPWVPRTWKYRGTAYREGKTLALTEDGVVASAETHLR